ncbi:MAG: ribosomal protein S18-alanine N-acetyltransferase [Gammaproteobacteria bacterium]
MSALLKPMTVTLRPMVERDVPEVIEIERQAYDFPWSKGVMIDCIRLGYISWVLEHERLIGAYSFMTVAAGEAHLLNLCVKPRWQGRRFGRTLLEHVVEDARVRGAETMFLEVRPSNGPGRQLYARAGFKEIGLRPDYYPAHEGREDALMLALPLPTRGWR